MFWQVITMISTGLSTVAAVVALLCLRRVLDLDRAIESELTKSFRVRRLEEVEQLVDDTNSRCSQLHESLRKVHARLAARDRREKASGEQLDLTELPTEALDRLPGEDDVSWKRRMKRLIAAGKLGHHG